MSMPAEIIDQSIPSPLGEQIALKWKRLQHATEPKYAAVLKNPAFLKTAAKVFACSDFVAEQCIRFPEMLNELFATNDILRRYASREYITKLAELTADIADRDAFMKTLRVFRRREIVRIIWRDLAAWSDFAEITRDLTNLADACIDNAAQWLYRQQCQVFGTPAPYQDRQQDLIIVALGKLGGSELNLSSDVDLLFVYPEQGDTSGSVKTTSHEQFFNRLGRDLIQILNQVTAEGFVFRVDMRLRPFGDSGPLAMHFAALNNYYHEHGRDWERYALMKARTISGNPVAAAQLMNMLRPFVYRHYVDYSAIEALRKMSDAITAKIIDQELENDIKRGPGGIREIEFITQAYQFIWGGENPWLQDRRLLHVLKLLAETQILSTEKAQNLHNSYVFLRTLENRLQAVADRQTHEIPSTQPEQTRIAVAMDCSSWQAFFDVLQQHRNQVENYFTKLVEKPRHDQPALQPALHDEVTLLWLRQPSQDAATTLTEMGFKDPEQALALLNTIHSWRRDKQITELGKERLNALMPILLMVIGNTDQPEVTLQRLLDLLAAMMRRSAYMVLLLENPKALKQLVKLCSVSPWIADHLAKYPLLLGELLDAKRLYAPLDLTTLKHTLEQRLAYLSDREIDEKIEVMRRFKLHHVFRVAAMDVTGVLPLMRVSDHLTNIAQVILIAVARLVWQQLTQRYGYPQNSHNEAKFAIIAYGKLGGIELGYGSDCDLVFVYDNDPDLMTEAQTNQEAISHSVFYIRLAQEIIRLLAARSTMGLLYEVDTRLRPSGESGLLATRLDTFAEYQEQEAWTWEHQALVRARVIYGSDTITAKFNRIKQSILAQRRDPCKLAQDVSQMREKMRAAAAKAPEGMFDLKQSRGGIADIEFIVQYGVLCWAVDCPALLTYPDNIRILEALGGEGLLALSDVRLLSDAYRTYRAIVHRFDLQHQPSYIGEDQLRDYRQGVIDVWEKVIDMKNVLNVEEKKS